MTVKMSCLVVKYFECTLQHYVSAKDGKFYFKP